MAAGSSIRAERAAAEAKKAQKDVGRGRAPRPAPAPKLPGLVKKMTSDQYRSHLSKQGIS